MRKVLVLLSTYNGEKFLEEQLRSLQNQQGVELDILIRDDGSKDSTVAYLSTMAWSNVTFYQGENKGATGSFLDLIEKASLEYDFYALCDQDDYWLEDKLSSALERLEKLEEAVPSLYYSGQYIVDKDLNLIYEHNLDIKRSVKANCIFNQMAGCTAVFNKALLYKLKSYSPSGIFGHDVWCYKVCAALHGNIVVESKGHILYRQHEKNVVGIKKGVIGKVQRARKYIFQYNASSYSYEILKGYGEQLSTEWYDFFKNVGNSTKTFEAKRALLRDKEIDFNSFFLRSLFVIKVLLGKM